jgi:hypothetical protein
MKLFKEDGTMFDSENYEIVEQALAESYIEPTDCVLELGARYGSVSILTNQKLTDKKRHVVVEPDETIWDSLEKNKSMHGCEFKIIKGIISEKKSFGIKYDGYATKTCGEGDNTKCYALSSLQLPFDTLIADCEGSLVQFFEEYPDMYKLLKKVIMEEDGDYSMIKVSLLKNGFIKIFEHIFPWISEVPPYYMTTTVWVKVANGPVNHTLQYIQTPQFSRIF